MKKNSKYGVIFLMLLIASIILIYLLRSTPLSSTPNTVSAVQEKVVPLAPEIIKYKYIEVVDGCDPYHVGPCVNMRSGPGIEYPAIERLRTGVVLRVSDEVNIDGRIWYKILLDKNILYPERITGDTYVSADVVELLMDEGDIHSSSETRSLTNTKSIVIDLSEQILYAYDDDVLFMKVLVSTGLKDTPTPRGIFSVFKKTPSRYMQGPIPGINSDNIYNLPGVPWDLYFTEDGAVIHGTYWHDHFGQVWSHGCVNLSPQEAKKLYKWASIDTKVVVQD